MVQQNAGEKFVADSPGQEFVIRTLDGMFFERMVGVARMVTTSDPARAFHFRSRVAALQTCATTHQFSGAYIVPYNPPQSQPEA